MVNPPSASQTIRVHLFARYAELLGADVVEIGAADVYSAGDVLARVRALPGGKGIGASTLIAVNLRQASLEAPVSPGDEVAILPPLAGG